MNRLTVGHEAADDAVIVRAEGTADISSVQLLVAELTGALQLSLTHPARLLVIDLRRVTYFGSAALNAVLECHGQGAASGISVRLVASDAEILRPIEVTKLDTILAVYPTLDRARQPGAPGT